VVTVVQILYSPELESLVEEIYKEDYELELYNLTMRKIYF
jgi:hypothetical protein